MLKAEKLSVSYNNFLALKEISIEIQEGTLTGIIGPNGAGKSTLLKAMLNIIPHQGKVFINNEDINKNLAKIAYVEQKTDIDFTFPIKVKECVSMGTYAELKVFQRIKNSEWERVFKALKKVNMEEYSNHQIGELSGGQFQRVLLARCLAQNADFIFLDEPFVGIDLISERIIMDTLKELKYQGKTVLIVHHDLSKVKKYFDNIVLLNQKLIAYGSVESVFNEVNLKEAYGDTIFIGETNYIESSKN
ncbi:metal ABC transporter ATP-binding protein [Enterococcus faecalis]|uniref:metal ABC transporter ATP-binding protein n=1 Tax=Enterococcus faecalis TaxID=1351 RepID=UPI00298337AB|nr:metal ABC transporter ATP-binding protein [Enterococcus faecalis]HBI1724445.1 metal ABC transporter ATP-binding protein [Enterococcus faecalis]HBI1727457.1 metal ABC transporter ATP-binding protein [Enterococcus faecalis]HBI1730399.1 metal ABC transporter ATP-binding protein [Enterococcus faecalis]